MGGQHTDTVIQGLEAEIERLSAKLRKAYDTHAETVEKFERDTARLRIELDSAYQLSTRLTSEKAHLAAVTSDAPDYAQQIDSQIRLLTIELKRSNEERRGAEERAADLEIRLAAAERAGADDTAAPATSGASAANDALDDADDRLAIAGASDRDLQQLVVAAHRAARESRDKLQQLDARYAAALKQIDQLTAELARLKADTRHDAGQHRHGDNADEHSELTELTELRARIEAAEYILGDYQAKLKQAEIDRDEALRDLKRLDSERRYDTSGNPHAGHTEPAPGRPAAAAMARECAPEQQPRVDQETENKRLRARLESAEKLAAKSMARAKTAEAERQTLGDEIASLNARLDELRHKKDTVEAATEKSFATRLHDAQAAQADAEQQSAMLQQQLAGAGDEIARLTQHAEALATQIADSARRAHEAAEERRLAGQHLAQMQARIHELEENSVSSKDHATIATELEQALEQTRRDLATQEAISRDLESKLAALQEAARQSAHEHLLQRDQANATAQDLAEQLGAMESRHHQALAEHQALHARCRELEADQQESRQQGTRLAGQLAAEKDRLLQLTREQAALVAERGRLVQELDTMAQRLASAEGSAAERLAALEANTVAEADHARLIADLEQARRDIHAQHAATQELGQRLAAAQQAADQAGNAAGDYRQQRDHARQQAQEAVEKTMKLEIANQQMREAKDALTDRCGQLEADQQKTQQQVDRLAAQLAARETQIARLTEQQQQLAQDLEAVTGRLADAGQLVSRQQAIIEALDRERSANLETARYIEADIAPANHQQLDGDDDLTGTPPVAAPAGTEAGHRAAAAPRGPARRRPAPLAGNPWKR